MKIGVIGASGFIGQAFLKLATEAGHQVVAYSRSPREAQAGIEWRVINDRIDLSGVEAVVNYAGESVAQRWTAEKKKQFHTSRVGVTELIIDEIRSLPTAARPKVLMNASAVGYYGDAGDTPLDESSPLGTGYLADLCEEWEQSAYAAQALGVRVVIGRIGIVLGAGGAAWEQMKTAFSLGLGGPLGTGRQWMPWVHVDDVAGGTLYALTEEQLDGPLNLVSPDVMRNEEFTKVLGKAIRRPAFIPAPAFALRLVFGEFGKHLLDSYRVSPQVLEAAGYEFKHPALAPCMRQLI